MQNGFKHRSMAYWRQVSKGLSAGALVGADANDLPGGAVHPIDELMRPLTGNVEIAGWKMEGTEPQENTLSYSLATANTIEDSLANIDIEFDPAEFVPGQLLRWRMGFSIEPDDLKRVTTSHLVWGLGQTNSKADGGWTIVCENEVLDCVVDVIFEMRTDGADNYSFRVFDYSIQAGAFNGKLPEIEFNVRGGGLRDLDSKANLTMGLNVEAPETGALNVKFTQHFIELDTVEKMQEAALALL
ncbi:hypothetical protein [Vibrio phage vB_VmeM-Yong XC32]|nr:hypothetical protein [Vibrio phage vB_VmeM-Yong XC31]QAX96552.1 hypothetical protein [Vibrio phage vB_VmeM-Yong XC32]QAX96870.1 hypothetical protein [Vibrio phage vB_VmeM-Yong MS31]QAX97175.1 hypothetical protein [Vibrio phage vB_VmeM-Yong MS32]